MKVFDVPFSITITGKVKAYGSTAQEAKDFVRGLIERSNFGVDINNLGEEGVLHDGSVSFADVKASEPNLEGQSTEIVETDEDPADYGFGIEEEGEI